MDSSRIGIAEEGGPYSYHPLADGDTISSDDVRLKQLGYKQELTRGLSAIANFSVTFSIISVITGLTTMYSTGLTYGGPLTMVYGWPIVGMLTLIVGLSMAEVCSAFPTSGGLYFWSAKLCGSDWGPFASWITGCIQAILDFLGPSTMSITVLVFWMPSEIVRFIHSERTTPNIFLGPNFGRIHS